MNGLMKRNLQIALGLSLMIAGTSAMAMNKAKAGLNVKKGEQVELKDLNAPQQTQTLSDVKKEEQTAKLSLKQRFVAACKAKAGSLSGWFSGLFSSIFGWFKTQLGSLKNSFMNLKMAQRFSKNTPKDTTVKAEVVPAPTVPVTLKTIKK